MLFGSIFDGFKKQEGKFLLLELAKRKTHSKLFCIDRLIPFGFI